MMLLGRRGWRLVERNTMVYRRLWLVLLAGLLEPCVYLLGIGYGIGSLIGPVGSGGASTSYAQFVAPALVATAAMNGAIYDTTFSVLHKLRYESIYDTMLSTPLDTVDIVVGEVVWALVRGLLYTSAVLLLTAALGLTPSAWTVLAPLGALLVTFCFGALGCAITTFLRSWQDIENVNLGQLVVFLFSGTLFPLAFYPQPLRWLAELSPLTRGVHLLRVLTTGSFDPVLVADVLYLGALGALGVAVASRRLARLVLT